MSNPFTFGEPGVTRGNALVRQKVVEQDVTDPTLGNGDGTYDVSVTNVRNLRNTSDVLAVEWSGSQKVSVDSVSGNTVTVLVESASGVDSYTNESDGSLSGTLTVRVRS